MTGELSEFFGEVIHTYTRAQAIADSVLVEADPVLRREAGITYPLAYTAAVYADCIAWPEGDASQDVTGREWDVLWMLRSAILRGAARSDGRRIEFELVRVPRGGNRPELVRLVAVCGPGDTAEPVLTVMRPGED